MGSVSYSTLFPTQTRPTGGRARPVGSVFKTEPITLCALHYDPSVDGSWIIGTEIPAWISRSSLCQLESPTGDLLIQRKECRVDRHATGLCQSDILTLGGWPSWRKLIASAPFKSAFKEKKPVFSTRDEMQKAMDRTMRDWWLSDDQYLIAALQEADFLQDSLGKQSDWTQDEYTFGVVRPPTKVRLKSAQETRTFLRQVHDQLSRSKKITSALAQVAAGRRRSNAWYDGPPVEMNTDAASDAAYCAIVQSLAGPRNCKRDYFEPGRPLVDLVNMIFDDVLLTCSRGNKVGVSSF